jgi:hypothetical protein
LDSLVVKDDGIALGRQGFDNSTLAGKNWRQSPRTLC